MFGKKKKKKFIEIKNYSKECSRNDKNEPRCLVCTKYIYPMGCTLNDYNIK